MLIRKFAAGTSLVLGLVMLSFSAPTIATAAIDGISVLPAAEPTGVPTGVPTDPPTSPSPTVPTPTIPSPSIPTPTTPEPTPTTPSPTIPIPTIPTPTLPTIPTPTLTPTDPVVPVLPAPNPGNGGSGRPDGPRVEDDDEGTTDPGADRSTEQGETSTDDPALGDPAPQGAVAPAGAVAPQAAPAGAGQALPDAGVDDNIAWMALMGVGLIVFGGVLVKRPRLARHRA